MFGQKGFAGAVRGLLPAVCRRTGRCVSCALPTCSFVAYPIVPRDGVVTALVKLGVKPGATAVPTVPGRKTARAQPAAFHTHHGGGAAGSALRAIPLW